MSVNKYINGKLLQMSGNADTRLTTEEIINILGYTPANLATIEETYGTKEYINNTFIQKTDIIDDLTSTDMNKPLSANQGNQLNSKINSISSTLGSMKYITNVLLGLNTDTTSSLENGLYLIFFSQTGAWDLTGLAFLSMTGYVNGSQYYFITGSSAIKSGLTVTIDAGAKTVTFNNGTGCQFRAWLYRMVSW